MDGDGHDEGSARLDVRGRHDREQKQEECMTAGRPLRILVALFALWAAASTADAQITTGTITGNIKDAQSGVIPGATVTLVSATRATTLATAVTNADGDYVFPNVPPDTYIVRV